MYDCMYRDVSIIDAVDSTITMNCVTVCVPCLCVGGSMFQKWMVCIRSGASRCNISSSIVNPQFDQTKSIIERTCIDRRNGLTVSLLCVQRLVVVASDMHVDSHFFFGGGVNGFFEGNDGKELLEVR